MGSVVGGILGPVIGGVIGASGSKAAADTQADAARDAAAVQRYMYDTTRADFAPYRQAGGLALSRLANHYGLGGYGDRETLAYLGGMGGGSGGGSGGGGQTGSGAMSAGGGTIILDPHSLGLGDEGGLTWSQIYSAGYTPTLTNSGLGVSVPFGSAEAAGDGTDETEGDTERTQEDIEALQNSAWDAFLSSPEYRVSREFTGPEMYRSLGASQSAGGRTALNAAGGVANTGALREAARYSHGLGLSTYGDYANRLASLAGLGQSSTQSLGALGAGYASNLGSAMLQQGAAQASGYMGAANTLGPAIGYGLNQFMGQGGMGAMFGGWNNLGVGPSFPGAGNYNYSGATPAADHFNYRPMTGYF